MCLSLLFIYRKYGFWLSLSLPLLMIIVYIIFLDFPVFFPSIWQFKMVGRRIVFVVVLSAKWSQLPNLSTTHTHQNNEMIFIYRLHQLHMVKLKFIIRREITAQGKMKEGEWCTVRWQENKQNICVCIPQVFSSKKTAREDNTQMDRKYENVHMYICVRACACIRNNDMPRTLPYSYRIQVYVHIMKCKWKMHQQYQQRQWTKELTKCDEKRKIRTNRRGERAKKNERIKRRKRKKNNRFAQYLQSDADENIINANKNK